MEYDLSNYFCTKVYRDPEWKGSVLASFSRFVLTLRFPLVVNAFWQTAHRKGLSPVCVRIWICRADDEEKFLRQTPQRCLEDTGGGGWLGPVGTAKR